VSALTRSAFVVGGKDGGSPFLRWLADGRTAAAPEYDRAAVHVGVDETIDGNGYLAWYRRLNFDYPFLDYAVEEGRRADERLMDAYSEAGSPPTPTTERDGERRALPSGGIEVPADGAAAAPGDALLGAWLQAVAGYKATSPGRRGPILHRTSPSGGARHPTDLGVALGPAWGDLVGQWWYDPSEHCLIGGALPAGAPDGRGVVFTVTSHVTRAMWRYRDVRAFRPVLYDAGHVIETLISVLRLTGWGARWAMTPSFLETSSGFDAALGHVAAAPGAAPPAPVAAAREERAAGEGMLRTNPFLSIVAEGSRLIATNHLRPREHTAVSGAMIDALAYATPSSRRDRPTDSRSIAHASGATEGDLAALCDAGLMAGAEEGDRLWQGIRPWSAHDWFLSALVHAEAADRTSTRSPTEGDDGAPVRRALPLALDQRRTCRSLSAEALPEEPAERLSEVLRAHTGVDVLLSTATSVGELPAGVHAISTDGVRTIGHEPLPECDVTRAAIGQPWARGFTCAIWLVTRSGDGTATQWEDHLVACGRLAQRIALAVAHDPEVGVFQTPAMVDARLLDLLPGKPAPDGVYLVGIGRVRGADGAHRQPLFSAQDLFRWTA